MCNCRIKIGTLADTSEQVVGIPLNGVLNNDFFSIIAWGWCINNAKVKAAFKAIGMDVDADDFPTLVEAHAAGTDVKAYGVDFLKLVTNIDFTQEEMEKASCSTILIRPNS